MNTEQLRSNRGGRDRKRRCAGGENLPQNEGTPPHGTRGQQQHDLQVFFTIMATET